MKINVNAEFASVISAGDTEFDEKGDRDIAGGVKEAALVVEEIKEDVLEEDVKSEIEKEEEEEEEIVEQIVEEEDEIREASSIIEVWSPIGGVCIVM